VAQLVWLREQATGMNGSGEEGRISKERFTLLRYAPLSWAIMLDNADRVAAWRVPLTNGDGMVMPLGAQYW
jgi:hypothetical protein